MSARFYVLYLKPKKGILADDARIVKQLNKAVDWIGIPPYTWILYSTSTPDRWYRRLKHFVHPDGNMFIAEVDLGHRSGWMGKKFWAWLKVCQRRSRT
jgi:hypothetical protein